MKIAIYKTKQSYEVIIRQRDFFDKIIHNDNKYVMKGYRQDDTIEVYCFDNTDIDDILPNLITGFSRLALFEVNCAKFFKP